MRKQRLHAIFGLLLSLFVVGLFALFTHHADAANPSTINFQGKVTNPDGTNVSNGTYSFSFRIYYNVDPVTYNPNTTACSSDTNCYFQETQTSVSVTNSIFQVELGSVCHFDGTGTCSSGGRTINFNTNNALYLTMQFNSDAAGYMRPMIHFQSVPFAFNADNLGGISAAGFIQNQTASLQQANIRIQSAASGSIAAQITGASGQSVDIFDILANGVGTALLGVTKDGFVTLQPAASLTSGQTALTQTLTNASSTGGTVNGYSQTVSVAPTSSASTTNGFNISLTDNTSLANANKGVNISLGGSNANQSQIGLNSSVNHGIAVSGASTGLGTTICAGYGVASSTGVCASSSSTTKDNGVEGVITGDNTENLTSSYGSGVLGAASSGGTASSYYVGVKGIATQTAAAAYTSAGVFGQGNGGSGATAYGGYFTLQGSSAALGSALYATNNTVAANILQLQDNTTDVMTVRDGGLVGIQNSFTAMGAPTQNNTSTSTSGGTLAATTYYYKITAIDSVGGETLPSAEKSQVTTGAASTVTLSWVPVTGASGYKIYRGTTALGGSGSEVYLTTTLGTVNGANLNYVDTGSVTAGAATPPSSGTAYTSTNNSNALGQIIVGGLGTPTGQVYVGGVLPKDITGGGVDLTGNPSGIYVSGKYAYIPDGSSLKIFDVSTPSAPVLVGSVGSLSAPRYVAVQGHYAYVTNNGNATVSIVDVSNPSSPSTLSSVTTAANPRAIYVQGRYAYVATFTGNTLQVIDISNPLAPFTIGSAATGSTPVSVYVQGNYAYVGLAGANKLQIFNISNPSSPTDVTSGGFSTTSSPSWAYVQGKYAYVTINGGDKLKILDISNPSSPVDVTGGGFTTGTGPQTVYVQGRYAYITLNNANKLQVIDISNPAKPFDVSGGGISTGTQPFQVAVSGRYAYVVNNGSNKFQVFDLGGTYSQQLEAGGAEVGTLQVDSNGQVAGDFNIAGGLSVGQSLNVNNGFSVQSSVNNSSVLSADSTNQRVGVDVSYTPITVPSGLTSTASAGTGFTAGQSYRYEVTAIDSLGGETTVSNEPTACSPASTNLRCTLAWTAVTGASGYRVYRTANGGGVGTEKYLTTVLTNAYIDANAITLSSINPPGSNTAYVSTNTATSLAQISIGGLGSPTGQVYISGTLPKDVTNGGFFTGTSTSTSGTFVQGKYAYTIDGGLNKFRVLDVSNPSAPVDVSNGGISVNSAPVGLSVQGHYAYVIANGGSITLQVIDISNPAVPVDVSSGGLFFPDGPNAIYVQGKYAYVVGIGSRSLLHIVDINEPSSLRDLTAGGVTTCTNPSSVYTQGRYIYVVCATGNKLQIFDGANPSLPVDLTSGGITTQSSPISVFVQGRYAYVVDSTASKLQVFDVSKPSAPVEVTSSGVATSSTPYSVYVQGRYAYLVTNTTPGKLQVFDISNPSKPIDVSAGGVNTAAIPTAIFVSGRYAYVSSPLNSGAGFQVYDLGGMYTQQLEAGGAEVGTLQVDTNGQVAGDFNILGGATIGQSLQVGGNIAGDGALYLQGPTIFGGGKNSLGAPTNLAAGAATSGGSLSGVYKYVVTAFDAYGGETTVSNEVTTASLGSPNQTQPLTWTAVSGASGYKVWRTSAGGGSGSETFLASTNTNSYSDTGAIATNTFSPSIPTTDTTGQLTVRGSALFKNTSNSTTALQIQNSSGQNLLVADTSNGQIILGTQGTSGVNGKLVFNTTNASNTSITLVAASTGTSYSLTLPTTGPAVSQCLQTDASVATQLKFASCGGGGGTLASTYNSAGTAGNTITYTTAGAGIIVQDASSPLSGNLLTFQNNGGTVNFLTLNLASSIPHLKIYDQANNAKYADIYYDDATSTAIFSASSGTTTVGSGTGAVTVTAGSGSAVTVTGHAASSFTTDAGNLTLQATAAASSLILDAGTSGNGTVTVGNSTANTITIGGNAAAHTVSVGSSSSGDNDVSIGSSNTGSTVAIEAGTAAGSLAIGNGATAHDIQIGTGAAAQTVKIGSTNGASVTTIQGGSGDIILTTSADNTVQIGSGTSDTDVVLFQLDSDSDFSADEGTCNATTSQGAMYYNTNTNAIRACLNSGWEDLVSTAGLGIMLFGVVPDSGSNPGDLLGQTATAHTTGPCKVSWKQNASAGNSAQVNVAPCVAYSGGRKVVVASTTVVTLNGTVANQWEHLCFTTSGAVNTTLSAATSTETNTTNNPNASYLTTHEGAPILCLADILMGAGTGNSATIANIFDVRTFTTTIKEYATAAAAMALGVPAVQSGVNVTNTTTTQAGGQEGIVIATDGSTSTSAPNVILAVAGPTFAKASGGTAGAIVVPSTATAARVFTEAIATTAQNYYMKYGVARTTFPATTCTATPNATNCDAAMYFVQSRN